MTTRKPRAAGAVKPELRWAIYGNCGLYIGQMQTRKDMIAQHVHDLYDVGSGFAHGTLSNAQREAWERCRKSGDRCVPVIVTPARRKP